MVRTRNGVPAGMTTGRPPVLAAGARGGGAGAGVEKLIVPMLSIGSFTVWPDVVRKSTWRALPPTNVPSTVLPSRRRIVSAFKDASPVVREMTIKTKRTYVIDFPLREITSVFPPRPVSAAVNANDPLPVIAAAAL